MSRPTRFVLAWRDLEEPITVAHTSMLNAACDTCGCYGHGVTDGITKTCYPCLLEAAALGIVTVQAALREGSGQPRTA